jgi:CBS domain-containing protein
LYGAIINALVGAFNLIPAFPLDGGRILRAGLVRWKKNYDDATRVAAKVGVGISYGFMALGFFAIISGSFVGGIWILLIGWFLNSGAQAYLSQHEIVSSLSRVRLGDIMNTRVSAVPETVNVNDLMQDYYGRFMKSSFPVIDGGGRLLGMVELKKAMGISENERPATRATDIMAPLDRLVVLGPHSRGDDALKEMMRKQSGKIFVCDDQGILLGIISKTDILNVASEQQDYYKEVRRTAGERKVGSGTNIPADSEAA